MPHCENCGSWVSEGYVRVFSDDGETVAACEADVCDKVRRGSGVRTVREPTQTKPCREAKR